MSVPTATALVLLAAAICGGCVADRTPDATAAAQRFQRALGDKDGAGACSELSETTARALEQEQGKDCRSAILELGLPTSTEVDRAQVYIGSAAVRAPGGVLFLNEADSGWKVSAAGCMPTSPGQPLDCDLED